MKNTRGEAIANTHASVVTIRDDKGYDSSDNEVVLDEGAITTELARLQTEYDAQEYARKRKTEYPSIEELVVALYDTDDKAAIDAKRAEIKLKYPKPGA